MIKINIQEKSFNEIKILENINNIIEQGIFDTLDAEIQDEEVLLFGEQSL